MSGGEDWVTVITPALTVDHAVVSAEDRDFFQHSGVDPVGIARALVANVRNESVQQGGSTITQQYVKNVYLTQERTFTRKIKEAALAVKVERELSKDEILTRYLNVIYFGRGAYGVRRRMRTSKERRGIPAGGLSRAHRSPETADGCCSSTETARTTRSPTSAADPSSTACCRRIHHPGRSRRPRLAWDAKAARPLTAHLRHRRHARARNGVLRRL
jgi:hypothetical protein